MATTLEEQRIHDKNLRIYEERGDRDQIKHIARTIRDEDSRLREKYPILNRQSLIGAMALAVAAGGFVVSAVLYVHGVIPAWACIVISAFCASIIREVEHDLVHGLYFKDRPLMQNAMMACLWPFLGNLPHPWYRRKVHLLHHRTSGHHEDLEERYIGNGMKWNWRRLVTTIDANLGWLFRRKEMQQIPESSTRDALVCFFPVAYAYYAVMLTYLGYHAVTLTAAACGAAIVGPHWLVSVMGVVNAAMVIYVCPNWLRQVCLQILSSNMHYYGDVDNRLQETQVMNAWYLLPLQVFTCNFGATHSMHHFVVNQPFYMRELCRKAGHRAMQECRMRFNDLGTFGRANRFGEETVVE